MGAPHRRLPAVKNWFIFAQCDNVAVHTQRKGLKSPTGRRNHSARVYSPYIYKYGVRMGMCVYIICVVHIYSSEADDSLFCAFLLDTDLHVRRFQHVYCRHKITHNQKVFQKLCDGKKPNDNHKFLNDSRAEGTCKRI